MKEQMQGLAWTYRAALEDWRKNQSFETASELLRARGAAWRLGQKIAPGELQEYKPAVAMAHQPDFTFQWGLDMNFLLSRCPKGRRMTAENKELATRLFYKLDSYYLVSLMADATNIIHSMWMNDLTVKQYRQVITCSRYAAKHLRVFLHLKPVFLANQADGDLFKSPRKLTKYVMPDFLYRQIEEEG